MGGTDDSSRQTTRHDGWSEDGRRPGPSISDELEETFERTVDEGEFRLSRTWPGLLATGFVGGVDVAFGVIGLLVVIHATGNRLLGALAFGVGFIALTLGRSELFTENFLVPIAALVAKKAAPVAVVRLWAGTATMNLLAGWVMMGLLLAALPDIDSTAVKGGEHFIDLGITWESFASAILGGALLTLMTWMERGTTSTVAHIISAWTAAFILAAAQLNHGVVGALEMLAGLHAGAPYGYADFAGSVAWAALGNMVGGIGLVTTLRLVQIGRCKVAEEQREA